MGRIDKENKEVEQNMTKKHNYALKHGCNQSF